MYSSIGRNIIIIISLLRSTSTVRFFSTLLLTLSLPLAGAVL